MVGENSFLLAEIVVLFHVHFIMSASPYTFTKWVDLAKLPGNGVWHWYYIQEFWDKTPGHKEEIR